MVAVDNRTGTEDDAFWLQDACVTIRALDALTDAGVMAALIENASTTEELAARFGLDRQVLGLALDVLGFAGIVACDRSQWTVCDPTVLRMTTPAAAIWDVLHGAGPPEDVSDPTGSAFYATLVSRLASLVAPLQSPLLDVLARPAQRVIEVAAGASPWGRLLCDADADTTVTAVDLPAVITTTEQIVTDAGHRDRYRFVAADVFEPIELGPADLVVVAGLCRLVCAERNHRLFRQIASWCAPGGRVAVIDAVATPDARAQGLSRYELGLMTRTSQGRCWSLDHYARWLTAAGCGGIDFVTTSRPEVSLVIARKEATT